MADSPRSIVIVGGGASGLLLAVHLLRRCRSRLAITIIEKRGQLGRGLAYSADRTDLILNVPASSMSAYADEPRHFRAWLDRVHPELPRDSFVFAPRQYYGAYLSEALHSTVAAADSRVSLTIVEAECIGLRHAAETTEVLLSDGATRSADVVVLAVGHEEQPARGRGVAVRADSDADTPLPPDAKVAILGSGLSMVDAWLSLMARRHRGPIVIISRHGRLPLEHRAVSPFTIAADDVPLGQTPAVFVHWFRRLVRGVTADGGDWRSFVDGLRPYNQQIWQSWSSTSRRQFLEHVRPFWNVHRHRLPPELHQRMQAAIAAGQLQLLAGHVIDLTPLGDGVRLTYQRRGRAEPDSIGAARVYDCGGVTLDVETSSNPAVRSLLATGMARPDQQRIGLDVTTDLQVIARDGAASPRLYAVGPLTRGKFFEIEAIPDIRRQCADLADRLLADWA